MEPVGDNSPDYARLTKLLTYDDPTENQFEIRSADHVGVC